MVTDRLGSVRANSNGETMRYYPYGEERTTTADNREKFKTYTRTPARNSCLSIPCGAMPKDDRHGSDTVKSNRAAATAPRKFIEELRAKQRNIVWPETLRNGRSVDAFFWRGFSAPTLVQRIGAWLFGLTFLGCGAAFLDFGRRDGSVFLIVFSVLPLSIGARVFWNGFPRKQTTEVEKQISRMKRNRKRVNRRGSDSIRVCGVVLLNLFVAVALEA